MKLHGARPLPRPGLALASSAWIVGAVLAMPDVGLAAEPAGAAKTQVANASSAHPAASVATAAQGAPSPHDRATLAAAVEANRIAQKALDAEAEAARWQTYLGIGALLFSGIAGLAAIAAALYARNAWRENRRSADVSERMLSGYERPFLLLEIVESGITLGDKSITFGVSKYRFRNLGRVPALLTRRHFELEDGAEMPDAIDPDTEAGKAVVHGIAVGADGVSQVYETGRALPLHSALKKGRKAPRPADDEEPTVYFHGFVEYRDLSGRTWITGFCFAQSDNEMGLQPLSLTERGRPDSYNYDRQLS